MGFCDCYHCFLFYIWGVKSSYDGEDLKDAEKVNKDVKVDD